MKIRSLFLIPFIANALFWGFCPDFSHSSQDSQETKKGDPRSSQIEQCKPAGQLSLLRLLYGLKKISRFSEANQNRYVVDHFASVEETTWGGGESIVVRATFRPDFPAKGSKNHQELIIRIPRFQILESPSKGRDLKALYEFMRRGNALLKKHQIPTPKDFTTPQDERQLIDVRAYVKGEPLGKYLARNGLTQKARLFLEKLNNTRPEIEALRKEIMTTYKTDFLLKDVGFTPKDIDQIYGNGAADLLWSAYRIIDPRLPESPPIPTGSEQIGFFDPIVSVDLKRKSLRISLHLDPGYAGSNILVTPAENFVVVDF